MGTLKTLTPTALHHQRWFLALGIALLILLIKIPPVQAGKLAVFRIDPLGVDPQIVAKLEGLFRLELSRLVDAGMPSAEQIRATLKNNPSLQNCTGDVQCLIMLGQLLHVEQVISGNVGGLGDSFVVNLKIVDVAAGKEIRRIQEPISGRPDQLIDAVRVAAYGLVAPERLRGALTVLTDQPGAAVYLDGAFFGKTPLPTLHGLQVGSHVLTVRKTGITDIVRTIRVRFQKTAQVVVNLPTVLGRGPRGLANPTGVNRPLPWYTRWWFWTAIGVVAAGTGAALGYALAGRNSGINCDADPSQCAN